MPKTSRRSFILHVAARDRRYTRQIPSLAARNNRWRTKVGGRALLSTIKLTPSRYRHVITKAQQSELPDESGGGILADEMGMGKSLTTLVLIEKTLNDALKWTEESKARPDGMMAKMHSRATLVIVPSHGKWFHTVSCRAIYRADVFQVLINTWTREVEE